MGVEQIAEEQREFAIQALLSVGALTTCMIHEDVIYEGSGDTEAAYKYANKVFSGNPKSFVFDDRREMTDTIKMIFEEYCGCDICPSCDD